MKYGVLYVDYDGVCCAFEKEVSKRVGMDISGIHWDTMDRGSRNKRYSDACDTVEFWANLELMPDFSTLWGYVKYWHPSILTAYPMWANDAREIAVQGKMQWNRKHTMVPESRFHCVKREDKQRFAINNGIKNILIDDHEKNINEWNVAGGEGILHTSAVSTITKLKLLGFRK